MDEVEFLKGAVSIYSTSGNERNVSEYLVSSMNELGFKAYVDDAGNAIGEIGEGKKTVLMVGHIDTVSGNIPVKIEEEKLYGRGSVDAKGPFCTFVIAAALAKLNCRVIVVGAVEEECPTSKGARFILDKYNPDYIIIGEPSGHDAITLGYKGRLLIDYEINVKNTHTAHGSESAIDDAITFYNNIKSYLVVYNTEKLRVFDQVQMTAQDIKYVSDGFVNTVKLNLGFRLPVDFDSSRLIKYAESIKKEGNINSYGHEDAIKADKNNNLVKAFLKSIRNNELIPKFKVKTGTSDMNILGKHFPGVPILAYGPGDSSLDHTPEEHIKINEYKSAIEILKGVLELL